MKYLMDSNSFITPKNIYYPFDLFPTYWKFLSDVSKDKKICLIPQINEELLSGHEEDLVKVWISNHFHGEIIENSSEIVEEWQNILNYIQECGLYNNQAFDSWASGKVADPWIIATAKVNGFTVVSLEERNQNLHIGSPTKSVKIPDICDEFNVPYLNLQGLLRNLKFVV